MIALAFAALGAVPALAEEDVVPAAEAVSYLDKETYTSAQIRQYYRGLRSKTIAGEGTVAQVRQVRKNYEVCVLVTGTTYSRPCNLVINTGQEEALNLQMGQKVSFEGQFVRLTPFVNYYVIIKGAYQPM
jgi:hypothetical protein